MEKILSILEDLTNRVKDIEYRLKHIIELPREIEIRLEDVERRIDKVNDFFSDLRKYRT